MDDTQDLPREVEDVETDDDLDDPAIASKEAAVTKKSLISRPSGEKAGTPKSSMKPSEVSESVASPRLDDKPFP